MEQKLANYSRSNSGYTNSNSSNNHHGHNGLRVHKSSSKIAKGSNKRSGGGGGVIQSAAANKQKKTSVFKIDKSDFRNAVQRLTGSPSTSDYRNGSSPPLSSRLHKNRPPPLSFSSGDVDHSSGGLLLPRLPLLTLASSTPSALGLNSLGFDGNVMSPAMQLPSPSFFSPLPPVTLGDHLWANTADDLVSQRPENHPSPWPALWSDPIPSYNRILQQPWCPVPFPSPGSQFTIPSPLPSPGGLEFPVSPNGFFSPLPSLFPSPTSLFPTGARTIHGGLNESTTSGLTAGFSFSHGHM